MKIEDIEPVGKMNIFTGGTNIYRNMSDFNNQIKSIDVYSKEKMQEYARAKVIEAMNLYNSKETNDYIMDKLFEKELINERI